MTSTTATLPFESQQEKSCTVCCDSQATPGIPGVPGTNGVPGNPGPKGDKGDSIRAEAGPPGQKGEAGSPGLKGEVGLPGPKGNVGPIGPPTAGIKGERGSPGLKGEQGLVGPQGPPGKAGPLVAGPRGRTGLSGAKGQKGDMGRSSLSAFSAVRSFSFTPSSGFNALPFDQVHTNVGEDFDGTLGRFTCEYPGIYIFSYSIATYTSNPHVYLMKNNDRINTVYRSNEGLLDIISNAAILQLDVGDQVWLQCRHAAREIYSNSGYYTTFSGVILHEI